LQLHDKFRIATLERLPFGKGLFGKYKDIFWWDSQMRGNADEGEIHSSYNVQAPDEH
jgi:hypothetical protein